MNFFSKFFSSSKKNNKSEELIEANPDKIKILPSVMSYCPNNIDPKKVLNTFTILINNNKDGDNSIFIAMAKIKESYQFLEKMSDYKYASAEWVENYSKAIEALDENAKKFIEEKKEGDKELLNLLNKFTDKK